MSEPKTMQINNVKYVREDAIKQQDVNTDGLEYVIVRSRDQGVMSGYLVGYEGTTVKLIGARQLWHWDSRFVLPDLAELGVRHKDKCKFSCGISGETTIFSACAIMPCTKDGGESIRSVEAQSK